LNLQQQEQFYQMMTRLKTNSRAASTKADAIVTEIVDGLIVSKPAKKIEYISEPASNPVLESKAASTQYETVVKKYDMTLPSTGDQIYKCGLHYYETRSLKEFNEHVAVLPHNAQENKLKAMHDFINGKH
jgi:hypothetical protein